MMPSKAALFVSAHTKTFTQSSVRLNKIKPRAGIFTKPLDG